MAIMEKLILFLAIVLLGSKIASSQLKCPMAHLKHVYQPQPASVVSLTGEAATKLESATTDASGKFKCAVPPISCTNDTTNYIYRSLDGSCNNLDLPGYGIAKSRYSRLLIPRYGDGNYSPTESVSGSQLPNARLLSLSMFGEETKPDYFRTMALMQFGQILAHDISHFTKNPDIDDCCSNTGNSLCYPINLLPNGPIYSQSGKKCISFVRAVSDAESTCPKSHHPYSEKITITTAFMDLSPLYGSSKEENRKIRQFIGGLLKTSILNNREYPPLSHGSECGKDMSQCYNIPDKRNQEIPTIIVMHVIFLREHNRIANALALLNPHYDDERLFQEARKINIAQYQHIAYYHWLPLILGPSYSLDNNLVYYVHPHDYVNDYNPSVNPAPLVEFSSAAFRYSHNQIPGWFSLVGPSRHYNETMRLSDYINRQENINFISYGDNFDSLVRGLCTQFQKESSSHVDKEIKHHFGRKANEEYGKDLKAVDIQRSRDFGCASYNDIRHYCGLPRAYDWPGFSNEIPASKIALLKSLYNSPDDVDLVVGGSLEKTAPQSVFGPTFQCVVAKQFAKTRTADRFFFEHENQYSGFTRCQLAEIRKSSLSGLFCNNADYLLSVQPNAFIFPNRRNILKSCSDIPQINLNKWKQHDQSKTYT